MKILKQNVVLGVLLQVIALSSVQAKLKEVQSRNPTSKNCPNLAEAIQISYAQEFGLNATEAKEVYVKRSTVSGHVFAQATHPSSCSPKGCGTTLSYLPVGDCPKIVLVFSGALRFEGKSDKRYSRVRVSYRPEAIDGKPSIVRYQFDENEFTYKELKNE